MRSGQHKAVICLTSKSFALALSGFTWHSNDTRPASVGGPHWQIGARAVAPAPASQPAGKLAGWLDGRAGPSSVTRCRVLLLFGRVTFWQVIKLFRSFGLDGSFG